MTSESTAPAPARLYKDSATPLYLQLAELLAADIRRGSPQPGGRLPNEARMSEDHQVSRLTVRKALSLLEEQGLIARKQGKGTFVSQQVPTIKQELDALDTLSSIMLEQGVVPRVEVLAFRRCDAPDWAAGKLELGADRRVLYIARRHLIVDEPVAVAFIYLPGEVGFPLSAEDVVRQPIHSLLQEKCGVILKEGKQSIWACSAERSIAVLLQVRSGTPLLAAERVICNTNGQPVGLTTFLYRSDRFEFWVSLPWMRERPRGSYSSMLSPRTGSRTLLSQVAMLLDSVAPQLRSELTGRRKDT